MKLDNSDLHAVDLHEVQAQRPLLTHQDDPRTSTFAEPSGSTPVAHGTHMRPMRWSTGSSEPTTVVHRGDMSSAATSRSGGYQVLPAAPSIPSRQDARSSRNSASRADRSSSQSEEKSSSAEMMTATEGGSSDDPERQPLNPSSAPTPSVDDTAFIRFAIDQLTRDEEVRATQNPGQRLSQESYSVQRIVPDEGLGYLDALRDERHRLSLQKRTSNASNATSTAPILTREPRSARSSRSTRRGNPKTKSLDSEIFLPYDGPLNEARFPKLTFVPVILRPLSLMTLAFFCLLMTAGLMFSAIYAARNDGLVAYDGSISSSEYFVFAFLPQIFAAIIMIYVHGVMAALLRITPFMSLATGNTDERSKAMFLRMFPNGFLLPEWEFFKCGRPLLGCCMLAFWLVLFTIPLQSSLFTVARFELHFRWTTVQGVAWTLVALYLVIFSAIVVVAIYLFRRHTGLMWDPTSLADMVAMLPRSNSLREFVGTEVISSKAEFKFKLGLTSNRLGYWRTPVRTQGVFYCLGEEGTPRRRYTGDGRREKDQDFQTWSRPNSIVSQESTFSEQIASDSVRFRYAPWYLRDTYAILWAVTGFVLLLALFVVSFLPRTNVFKGFPPLLDTGATAAGFSPANFVYGFVPSFIGLLLYLFFQTLDLSLRRLQPWAGLADLDGVIAEKSLLLEYSSSVLPLQCTVRALVQGHWRVALFSAVSLVNILLPVLGGGIFMGVVQLATRTPIVLTQRPAFIVILVMLVLYLAALVALLPWRRSLHLPHDIDSPAGIISFLYASDMLQDPAFRAPRSKIDLVERLESATEHDGGKVRYAFGIFRSSVSSTDHLGVTRLAAIQHKVQTV